MAVRGFANIANHCRLDLFARGDELGKDTMTASPWKLVKGLVIPSLI